MHIAQLTIRNILGIEELEFAPGGFTTIGGPNGAGKSSVLEAIKAALSPGHDATLLRAGAEKGEVVFVLDDGMTITKKVAAGKSVTEVRDVEGKKVDRPAETIKALTDMLSINPVAFLAAEKKDRVKVLLESMPIAVDAAKLTKLSGIKVTAAPGQHALHVIELVAKQVYDDRTGTNRAVKEKDATISQLRQAMPDAPAEGVTGSEAEIVAQVEAATAARDTKLGQVDTKINGIKDAAQTSIGALRVKLQEDIDALKAAAQTEVDKINADTAENESKAQAARDRFRAAHTATVEPLNIALAAIRADRSNAAKREQAQATIGTMETELVNLRATAERQTAALAAIDKYKSDLLSKLPIQGLEVRDGEIFRDGVPFDRVNTAGQVGVAVSIAKLRAGDLGVVCVDRIESLDDGSLEELRTQMGAAGLQAFVTMVTPRGSEFSIDTED